MVLVVLVVYVSPSYAEAVELRDSRVATDSSPTPTRSSPATTSGDDPSPATAVVVDDDIVLVLVGVGVGVLVRVRVRVLVLVLVESVVLVVFVAWVVWVDGELSCSSRMERGSASGKPFAFFPITLLDNHAKRTVNNGMRVEDTSPFIQGCLVPKGRTPPAPVVRLVVVQLVPTPLPPPAPPGGGTPPAGPCPYP